GQQQHAAAGLGGEARDAQHAGPGQPDVRGRQQVERVPPGRVADRRLDRQGGVVVDPADADHPGGDGVQLALPQPQLADRVAGGVVEVDRPGQAGRLQGDGVGRPGPDGDTVAGLQVDLVGTVNGRTAGDRDM